MVKGPRPIRRAKPEHVCQFLILLPRTDPLVWRRIQVPERYSFWDLHVAIQDAMGWRDYHLHEFILIEPKTGRRKRIGVPDDEMPGERPCVAGWKVPIRDVRHPERAALLEWAGGRFDPEAFDPKAVRFDNPQERRENAFRR